MKPTIIAAVVAFFGLLFVQVVEGKEIKEVSQAFSDYNDNKLPVSKNENETEKRLNELLKKLKDDDQSNLVANLKEELSLLASLRAQPSKKLLSQMKELWIYHYPRTYKVRYPEDWKYVTGIDYDQKLCDEIKGVYVKMGGSPDDLSAPKKAEK